MVKLASIVPLQTRVKTNRRKSPWSLFAVFGSVFRPKNVCVWTKKFGPPVEKKFFLAVRKQKFQNPVKK
jgi:hypothetical protein